MRRRVCPAKEVKEGQPVSGRKDRKRRSAEGPVCSLSACSNCVLCHAEFQKAKNEDLTVGFGKSEVIDHLDKCGFRGVGR